jgi:hypothetical protein
LFSLSFFFSSEIEKPHRGPRNADCIAAERAAVERAAAERAAAERAPKEPLERRISDLEGTVASHSSQIASLSRENAALKTSKRFSDKEIADLKERSVSLAADVELLMSALSGSERDESSAAERAASLSSEKAEWQSEKMRLKEQLRSLEWENSELKDRLVMAVRDRAVLEKEKAAVEVQLEKMTSEVSLWRWRLRLLAKSFERCVTFFDGKIGVPESFPSHLKDPVNGGVMFDCVMTEASREVVDRASAIAASLAAGDAFEDMFCVGHPLSFSEGPPRDREGDRGYAVPRRVSSCDDCARGQHRGASHDGLWGSVREEKEGEERASVRETEREREREKETETDRDRQRDRQRQGQRERERSSGAVELQEVRHK